MRQNEGRLNVLATNDLQHSISETYQNDDAQSSDPQSAQELRALPFALLKTVSHPLEVLQILLVFPHSFHLTSMATMAAPCGLFVARRVHVEQPNAG